MLDNTANSVSITQLTPLSFLARAASVWGDKVGVIDGTRGITYAEFATDAQALARAIIGSGYEPGVRVATLMPNVAEMLLAHFGVPLAGGVLVAVNTRLAAEEIRYIVEHSGSRVLIAHQRFAGIAESALSGLNGVELIIPGTSGWEEFHRRGAMIPSQPWTVPDERGPISINYTSGTTGRPKGVVYSHRGAYLNALGELLHSHHDSDSVYLWTLPMFHCNGWCTTWAVTAIGGTHVCLPDVRADAIWSAIDRHGVTHLNAAPTVLTIALNAPEAHVLERPIWVTMAGAAPSPTLIAQLERSGFLFVHVYGLTEVYGPYSVCESRSEWRELPPQERAKLLARQGVGMIQTEELRVVDDQMNDVLPDGETLGEIVMRGNNVMLGYYRDDEGTAEAFRGGWFHSGDLGVRHPDGYVELRDRAKDIVVSGGENISTIEVEQALMTHPAVLEAAVVGVPDDHWGEVPRAFVVLKAGGAAEEPELIEHVRARIATFKAPRYVDLVDELPKTSTGKIQKYALRSLPDPATR